MNDKSSHLHAELTTLFSEANKAHRKNSDKIVILNDLTDNHVAVGEDAERLFEMFGWQTATAIVGNERMSIMPICDDILQEKGLFGFQQTETMVDLLDIRVENAEEAELSIAQQTIDAFRRCCLHKDIVFPTEGLQHHLIEHGVEHEHVYPFVEKSGDSLSLICQDARRESVVSGQSWNVSRERIPLLSSLAEYLHMLMHDMEKKCIVIGEQGRVWSELQSQASFNEYEVYKNIHEDKRLIVDHGAFYEAYGDDAVFLARLLHLPLWSRYCGKRGDVQLLMLSPNMADMAIGLYGVQTDRTMVCDDLCRMRLRPSFLNDFLHLEEIYEHASLLVKKDGGYAVRASLNGSNLPMRDIPKDMGDLYMSMSEGLAKSTFLNGILHAAYDRLKKS